MKKPNSRAPVERKDRRNRKVVEGVLRNGMTLKDVANIHRISGPRARSIVHQFCYRANPDVYMSIDRKNDVTWGLIVKKALPSLNQLRKRADDFLTSNED